MSSPREAPGNDERERQGPQPPENAFVDPRGNNRREVEPFARSVFDLVLDLLAGAAERPPLPGAVASPEGPLALPAGPVPEGEIVAGLRRLFMASMNPSHPGWIGHMDPPPTTASVLGAFAAAALNNNLLAVEMSPALSRLEARLTAALAGFFGLPAATSGGVLASGGTLANLQALAVARNVALPVRDRGLHGEGGRPVILASELAHASIAKAAMLLGLGTSAVVAVPVDGALRMRGEALGKALARVREEGRTPISVVATAGTTVTGSIDALAEIAAVAREGRLWLHVDAAIGGSLAFSPGHRDRLAGIAAADSITWNPQKGLCVAKTSAMVLFRDLAVLESVRVGAPYTREPAAGLGNFGEISVQGTRSGEVLKFWLSLQHFGLAGCAALVDASVARAERFAAAVRSRPDLALAAPPDCGIVCFRGTPAAVPESGWDAWNTALQEELLADGVFLSLPLFQGGRWLRAVWVNPHTDEAVLERLWARVDRFRSSGPTS